MKKNKIIKPDNLKPKEKKRVLLKISLLSLLIAAFFIYRNYINTEKKYLLENNYKETVCKIIGISTYKVRVNIVEYEVSGKTYSYRSINSYTFEKGEFFKIKYSNSNPKVAEVIYTVPVIYDKSNYKETKGKIIHTDINSDANIIKFTYTYLNNEYTRSLYVKNSELYKKGEEYKILVNKKNPKISYLSDLLS